MPLGLRLFKSCNEYASPVPQCDHAFTIPLLDHHMALKSLFVAVALSAATRAYIWPNPQLDALESLRYDQYGYNRVGTIIGGLTPCTTAFSFDNQQGRSNAADWIRNVRRVNRCLHIFMILTD
jgi:hypothetical protein